jgi:hypothetical protein
MARVDLLMSMATTLSSVSTSEKINSFPPSTLSSLVLLVNYNLYLGTPGTLGVLKLPDPIHTMLANPGMTIISSYIYGIGEIAPFKISHEPLFVAFHEN